MIKDLSSSFLALGNWEKIDMNMQLVRRRAGQITDGKLLALFHFPQCAPTFLTHTRKSSIHYMGVTRIFFFYSNEGSTKHRESSCCIISFVLESLMQGFVSGSSCNCWWSNTLENRQTGEPINILHARLCITLCSVPSKFSHQCWEEGLLVSLIWWENWGRPRFKVRWVWYQCLPQTHQLKCWLLWASETLWLLGSERI